MPFVAGYNTNRYYEGRIHEIRVSQNLTVMDLVKLSKCSQSQISGLANGTISPIYVTRSGVYGKTKSIAKRIAKALHTSIETLFPHYFCLIGSDILLNDQLSDFSLSQNMRANTNPEYILQKKQFYGNIKDVMQSMSKRCEVVLILRFQYGYTLDDIGKRLNISKQRASQLEIKIISKIRQNFRRYNVTFRDILNN